MLYLRHFLIRLLLLICKRSYLLQGFHIYYHMDFSKEMQSYPTAISGLRYKSISLSSGILYPICCIYSKKYRVTGLLGMSENRKSRTQNLKKRKKRKPECLKTLAFVAFIMRHFKISQVLHLP